MKINIELDIPKDTYSHITKWLSSNSADSPLREMLQRELELTVQQWKGRADMHFRAGGKNAWERFKAQIGDDNE